MHAKGNYDRTTGLCLPLPGVSVSCRDGFDTGKGEVDKDRLLVTTGGWSSHRVEVMKWREGNCDQGKKLFPDTFLSTTPPFLPLALIACHYV